MDLRKLPWSMTFLISLAIGIRLCLLVTAMGDIQFDVILEGSDFLTVYGHSLLSCQEQCANRLKCKSINYRRHSPYICTLNTNRTLDESTLKPQSGWVYKDYPESKTLPASCPNCTVNEVCEDRKCVIKECEPLVSNSTIRVHGNINTINGKAILACPDGKYPTSPDTITTWPVQTVCTAAGNWNVTPFECSELDKSFCHKYLVSEESVPWSIFKKERVHLVDGPCGVNDNMLSASSSYRNEAIRLPDKAKFSLDESWVTSESGPIAGQWIQVQFDDTRNVTGIVTRGRGAYNEYVTYFNVTYTTNCSANVSSWLKALDSSGNETFTGNADNGTKVDNRFETPIIALCVRIYPVDGFSKEKLPYTGLQFDLYRTVKLPVF